VSVAAAKTHLVFVWQTYGRVQEGIVKKCTTVCSLDYSSSQSELVLQTSPFDSLFVEPRPPDSHT
jgi:hypothetical protein